MEANHDNPFDYLSELELNSPDNHKIIENTDVFSELRFDKDELEFDDYFIEVSVTLATLELELWGCDIVPGSRLNDLSRPSTEVKQSSKRERLAKAAVSGKAGAKSDGGMQGTVSTVISGQLSGEAVNTIETETNWKIDKVVCRSGKRWIVSETPETQPSLPLIGTFIPNQRLCAVVARSNANMTEVTGRVMVRRRDLIVEPEGNAVEKTLRKIKHQQKFAAAILAKSIVADTGQEQAELTHGKFILSQSTLSSENNE